MNKFVIVTYVLSLLFVSCASNNSNNITLTNAWESTANPFSTKTTYIEIKPDSTGTYFTSPLDYDCYEEVSLSITDGILLIGDAHFTYEMTDSHLNLLPMELLDTLQIGYSFPEAYLKTEKVSLKTCD